MKIAFLLPVNGISGGINVVYHHAECLLKAGHEVVILFSDKSLGNKIEHKRIEGYYLDYAIGKNFDVAIATWWETFYDLYRILDWIMKG